MELPHGMTDRRIGNPLRRKGKSACRAYLLAVARLLCLMWPRRSSDSADSRVLNFQWHQAFPVSAAGLLRRNNRLWFDSTRILRYINAMPANGKRQTEDDDFIRFGLVVFPSLRRFFDYLCHRCAYQGRYVVNLRSGMTLIGTRYFGEYIRYEILIVTVLE